MKQLKKILLALFAAVCAFAVTGCFDSGKHAETIDEPFVEYYYWDMQTGEEIVFERVPINEGDTFEEIEGPSLPGYSFLGWFGYNEQFVNGDALPSEGVSGFVLIFSR